MTASGVAGPYGTDALSGPSQQRVHERGLSHARHADQDQRLPAPKPRFELFHPDTLLPAHEDHRNIGKARCKRRGDCGWLAAEVALVDDDQGSRAALRHRTEVTTEPALVDEPQVAIRVVPLAERANDSDDIHVGSDDLQFGTFGRRLAHE